MTTIAKLFKNGRSQAVRLPRQFRFEGDRVQVRRAGRGVLVEPISPIPRPGLRRSTVWRRNPSCPMDVNNHRRRRERSLMTTYLLDTNVCIGLINGRDAGIRRRFQRAAKRNGIMLLSSIVSFELWYGVAKSERKENDAARLAMFLAGPLEWTPLDDEDAKAAGAVRAELEAAGQPIGAYDVLLAGQARRHRATPVTANTREFARVSGLKWVDWAGSQR